MHLQDVALIVNDLLSNVKYKSYVYKARKISILKLNTLFQLPNLIYLMIFCEMLMKILKFYKFTNTTQQLKFL